MSYPPSRTSRTKPLQPKRGNEMFEFAVQWIKDNIRREEGQTMAEYGLILALIAVVVAAVMVTLGGQIRDTIQSVIDSLTSA
jgi:pilus assembly protein Flp/PilA